MRRLGRIPHPLNSGNILTGRYSVIQVAPSTLLTVQVAEGGSVQLYPLTSPPSQKQAMWVKSLRQATVASSIQLEEVDFYGNVMAPLDTAKKDKGKRRDWLTLLARESLGLARTILCRARN